MADKTLKCKECGTDFIFTENEQAFFKEKGFENEPQRCADCRTAKKQQSGNDRVMKSFGIDFNWDGRPPAAPGVFAKADAKKIVDWYADLGVNNFWTLLTTVNGYAWYPSKLAPVNPGLETNFMKDSTDLGHRKGLEVFGYVCLGQNTRREAEKPEEARPYKDNYIHMVFTDEYLEFLCAVIKEGLNAADIDGIVIDWFRNPNVKRPFWLDSEKKLYKKLTGENFPESGDPGEAETIEFDRKLLESAWINIKGTVDSTRKVRIWTNQPFDKTNDPIWNGHILMKEADYLLNEGPDMSLLDWIGSQAGPNTTIVQNICGWPTHDSEMWKSIDTHKYGLFGFAPADVDTCLPSIRVSEKSFRNIEIVKEAYKSIF